MSKNKRLPFSVSQHFARWIRESMRHHRALRSLPCWLGTKSYASYKFAQISQGEGGRRYINYSYFYENASKLVICIVNSKTGNRNYYLVIPLQPTPVYFIYYYTRNLKPSSVLVWRYLGLHNSVTTSIFLMRSYRHVNISLTWVSRARHKIWVSRIILGVYAAYKCG